MEREARSRWKRNELSALILRTIEGVGLIGMALVAPNVVGAIGKMGLLPHQRDTESIKRAVDRLYERGYLKHTGGKLAMTEKGRMRLQTLDVKFKTWKPPASWDKRWRVVVFDIPESKRRLRSRIRVTLKSIGFEQLQKSVWVYPYDCEEWVTLWKADFKLGSELLYMIVDSIEGESLLRRIFKLK